MTIVALSRGFLNKRRAPTVVAVLSATLAFFPSPARSAAQCTDANVAVALGPGAPKDSSVYGLLCQPASSLPKTIQILVAGATEGGLAYWDFPHPDYYGSDPSFEPLREKYSYAKYLTDAGYASLTLDRIGTGKSDHPPAADVTIPSNAFVIHQVVQALRGGELPGGVTYDTVVGGGHSLGAPILFVESVQYGDLDGMIVESYRHHRQPAFATFLAGLMPAQLEPRFASVPLGYLTTRPGARDQLFYAPNAELAVMEHEEVTKETMTGGELLTFPPYSDYAKEVAVPVVSLVGDRDAFFCSAPGCPEAGQEAGSFPKAPCFESHVIPDAGHEIDLQANGRAVAFPMVLDWVTGNFGPAKTPCGG